MPLGDMLATAVGPVSASASTPVSAGSVPTPHPSGYKRAAATRAIEETCDRIMRVLRGRAPRASVVPRRARTTLQLIRARVPSANDGSTNRIDQPDCRRRTVKKIEGPRISAEPFDLRVELKGIEPSASRVRF